MAKEKKDNKIKKPPVKKRTSIGLQHSPLNKSKRRSFKPYRGQGKVSH